MPKLGDPGDIRKRGVEVRGKEGKKKLLCCHMREGGRD